MTDQYYDTIMGKLCTQGTDLNVSVETLREILSMIPFTTEIVPTCTEFVDNFSLGSLFKSTWVQNGKQVSGAILKSGQCVSDIKRFITYVFNLYKAGNHPNIIKFYGVTQIFEGEKNLNALIESAHFDLETYLFRPGVLITNGFSSTFDKRNISLQLIEAIKYLHEIGMVHSMISTSEILVKIIDSTPKILLSSIGGFVHEDHMLERCPSGARYLSPEQFTEMKSTYHSDIYSLGMVLWSIFSGRHPFENCDLRMATLAIMNGEKNHIPVIDTVDPDIMSRRKVLSKTLNACWDLDPVKRPTIDRVLEVCEYLNEKDLVFWWTPTLVKKVLPTLPVKFYFKN